MKARIETAVYAFIVADKASERAIHARDQAMYDLIAAIGDDFCEGMKIFHATSGLLLEFHGRGGDRTCKPSRPLL